MQASWVLLARTPMVEIDRPAFLDTKSPAVSHGSGGAQESSPSETSTTLVRSPAGASSAAFVNAVEIDVQPLGCSPSSSGANPSRAVPRGILTVASSQLVSRGASSGVWSP
jgi:hypothetical protein